MIRLWKILASIAAGTICLSAILGHASRNSDSRVETMLELRDASSHAQYRALEREAHALFLATLARCRHMQDTHFSHCAKDAREHLYDDLSEAKRVSGTNL